jgi:hypothetical protein
MSGRCAVLAAILAASWAFAQTTTSVTISGTVADESGNPIAGAKVYYNNSPASVRDRAGHTHLKEPFVSSSVITGKDGTFSVTSVPPGVYWLCAEVSQQNQIRSCDWGFGGTKIDLTTGSSAANTKLQVHSGVTMTFQVTDARNQIKDFPVGALAPGANGNFRIFVTDGPMVKLARLVSVNGNVHQYEVTVPATRALRMLLDTKLSVINQKSSAAVATGKPDDAIVISGQPVTYNLTIP